MPSRRDIEKKLRELEDVQDGGGFDITIRHSLIMRRERAERENREILGPSEEAAEPGYVRVPAGEEEIRL